MKIFLQDCETGKFIRCDSLWTADAGQALDFLSAQRAFSFGLTNLETAFQVLTVALEGKYPAVVSAPILPKQAWASETMANVIGQGAA